MQVVTRAPGSPPQTKALLDMPIKKLKNRRRRELCRHLYFRFILALHRPLVKPGCKDPYHAVFPEFIELTRQVCSPSVLEMGSRDVTGVTRREQFPHCSDYVGFDVLPGPGVQVVGDAHSLSGFFPPERFDFVYAISVFEHLLFPWKVALEINKVLKPGGCVYVSTHPVWPEHEMPWDFWRYPHNGFHALFNRFTGFEIVTLTEGLPCRIYSLVDDWPTRGNCFGTTNQGVALIARKTGESRGDLLRWDIGASDILDTMYPSRQS
jgi:SAM-dependent methyltransferase